MEKLCWEYERYCMVPENVFFLKKKTKGLAYTLSCISLKKNVAWQNLLMGQNDRTVSVKIDKRYVFSFASCYNIL